MHGGLLALLEASKVLPCDPALQVSLACFCNSAFSIHRRASRRYREPRRTRLFSHSVCLLLSFPGLAPLWEALKGPVY